jgi:hypothetical protein
MSRPGRARLGALLGLALGVQSCRHDTASIEPGKEPAPVRHDELLECIHRRSETEFDIDRKAFAHFSKQRLASIRIVPEQRAGKTFAVRVFASTPGGQERLEQLNRHVRERVGFDSADPAYTEKLQSLDPIPLEETRTAFEEYWRTEKSELHATLFGRLGFQSADRLVRVNGVQILSFEDLQRALEGVEQMTRLEVQLTRSDRPITLTYNFY